jgi:lipopolysaccharide/colanic/teichoic acid biosynthesis glycosyltransferase
MYKVFFKRLLDIMFGIISLIPFVIIFIIFAPIIYLNDKGSVFYISKRVGKNGNIFNMYKFRSMYVNAPDIRNEDGSTYNSATDSRVTKVGRFMRKTSLDETAQILNVLLGDMSVIGPRPATLLILENLTELQRRRFAVRPGITGYTQMMYRNSVQGEKRYLADLFYVEHISFLLDLKILLKTAVNVIRRENIFNEISQSAGEKVKEKAI